MDPFFLADLKDAQRSNVFGHFYMLNPAGELWEIAYAPVQPSSDTQRITAPKGFLVAMRKWGADFCARQSVDARAQMQVVSASEHNPLARTVWKDAKYSVEHTFVGRNGDNIAFLVETTVFPIMVRAREFYGVALIWIIAGSAVLGLISLVAGYLFMGNRIRRLLRVIRIGDISAIESATGKKNDFGLLADAVQVAYTKKNSTQHASLGRDVAEEKLVQREKFLSTILRHLNGAILVISHEGILTLAEGRDLDAYGFSKERDVGRPISNVLRGQERLVVFEQALQGKRSSSEQRVGDKTFLTMCEPLAGSGSSTDFIVVLALDVTEKRLVEETLTRAKQQAENADKIKTQFLSVMSHETRTPLNGVLGFASVLRETPLNEEQMSYLDRIVESGQNLLRLLTDILDLARLEAGEGKRNMEPVSLLALVYQFAERYRLACQRKGHLEFDLDIDQRLPDNIESDSEMLSRILSSLLDNAVKFTDSGRVKLGVAWVPMDKDGRNGVMFTIADTGPGITPEVARTLFNPFQQGDSSNTRQHGGLGLGLTIAQRLATQLDGRLTYETKVDVGTTFSFFLPTRILDEAVTRKYLPQEQSY